MIVLAYDGSADADAAIDHAARLMPGAEAVVLTVWEPMSELYAHPGVLGGPHQSPTVGGLGMVNTFGDPKEIDQAREQAALATATAGAERARAAGLKAQPRQANHSCDLATTILAVASEVDAGAIVMGTRGRGDVTSFLLGSVSHAVVHHAERPVLIVPSPERAERRLSWLDRAMAAV